MKALVLTVVWTNPRGTGFEIVLEVQGCFKSGEMVRVIDGIYCWLNYLKWNWSLDGHVEK